MRRYEKPTFELMLSTVQDVVTLSANQRDVTATDVDWNADLFGQN